MRQLLSEKLGSLITPTTSVSTLTTSTTNNSADVINIAPIQVQADGIYVFGVNLSNFTVGDTLIWTPNVSNASTGEYIEASEDENNAVFLDDSGNETTVVPFSKHVNVAAYFEKGKTYEPTISTSYVPVGSSSGGCDAGLGAIVSAIAAAFFISKKRS